MIIILLYFLLNNNCYCASRTDIIDKVDNLNNLDKEIYKYYDNNKKQFQRHRILKTIKDILPFSKGSNLTKKTNEEVNKLATLYKSRLYIDENRKHDKYSKYNNKEKSKIKNALIESFSKKENIYNYSSLKRQTEILNSTKSPYLTEYCLKKVILPFYLFYERDTKLECVDLNTPEVATGIKKYYSLIKKIINRKKNIYSGSDALKLVKFKRAFYIDYLLKESSLDKIVDDISECQHTQLELASDAFDISTFTYGINAIKDNDDNTHFLYEKMLPNGYDVEKEYTKNKQCIDRGFRAVKVIKDNIVFYAFRGTVLTSKGTVFADGNLGVRYASCLKEIIQDAVSDSKIGKNIIFTGHSLGGALSEMASYLTQKELILDDKNNHRSVKAITWNGLGGQDSIERYIGKKLVDKSIYEKIDSINFCIESDIICKIGRHTGESRFLNFKNSYQELIFNKESNPINAHGTATLKNYLISSEKKTYKPETHEQERARKLLASKTAYDTPINTNRYRNFIHDSKPTSTKNFVGNALSKVSNILNIKNSFKNMSRRKLRQGRYTDKKIEVPYMNEEEAATLKKIYKSYNTPEIEQHNSLKEIILPESERIINSAISKLPNYEGRVFKQINLTEYQKDTLSKINTGTIVNNDDFMLSSKSNDLKIDNVNNKSSKHILVEIMSKKGKELEDHVTDNPLSGKVLFDSKTKFKVISYHPNMNILRLTDGTYDKRPTSLIPRHIKIFNNDLSDIPTGHKAWIGDMSIRKNKYRGYLALNLVETTDGKLAVIETEGEIKKAALNSFNITEEDRLNIKSQKVLNLGKQDIHIKFQGKIEKTIIINDGKYSKEYTLNYDNGELKSAIRSY